MREKAPSLAQTIPATPGGRIGGVSQNHPFHSPDPELSSIASASESTEVNP